MNIRLPQKVLVYNGEGAGPRCALSLRHSLERVLKKHAVEVSFISTDQLLAEEWTSKANRCILLCMPGGADLPYCKHLNGRGNRIIRNWVESGGAYLGLCAGAYYASGRCVFEPGSVLQVVEDRELQFFPGHARGGVYPGFQYGSELGAAAAPLLFRSIGDLSWNTTAEPEPLNKETSASGASEPGPFSANGVAVSSDPRQRLHVTASAAGRQPSGRRAPGASVLSRVQASEAAPASLVLGRLGRRRPASAGCAAVAAALESEADKAVADAWEAEAEAALAGQPSSQGPDGWSRCSDYSNGGPMLLNHLGGSDLSCYGDLVEVLAVYQGERGELRHGAAAAVRCQVGDGIAVLCGTHPELDHTWLTRTAGVTQAGCQGGPAKGGLPGGAAQGVPSADTPGEGNVPGRERGCSAEDSDREQAGSRSALVSLVGRLEGEEAGRRALWCMLLYSCLA